MNIASRGATMAVDWEQRIDFARLRSERLEKARASLRDSDLGAVLLFDQNNIRYVSSTHIGEWARDKSARCVLLPARGRPGAVGLRLGGEAPPALRAVAPGVELAGGRHLDARGDAARDRACRMRSPRASTASSPIAGSPASRWAST